MKKHVSFFVAAFLAVAFLLTTQVAALSSPPTGQFTYFYIPPQDGTSTSSLAALNKFIILTHGDETYRSSLRSAGYAGLVLQYLLAAEVDGPGPYANSTAPCNSSFQGHRNQVALDPGDFCTYLHPYESYFLHNSQGQRLYERGWDSSFVIYAMNPAAPGWRSFFIQRALRELQGSSTYPARGFDGLFLDNVWISLWTLTNKMVVNASGYPQEFPSDAAYQAAMAGFLSQLHAALTAHPWPLLGNMASDDYSASSWDAYLPYVDGGMAEAFAADWSTGYPSVSDWLTDLAKAEKVAAQGKTFLAITQGAPSDTSRMRFGYGSYLLVMQPGRTFFRYAKASQGYEYQWSYPDFWTDLGTPVGARFQQADGSWRRNFSRGYVVVNPSTHSAQLVQQASAPHYNHAIWLPIVKR